MTDQASQASQARRGPILGLFIAVLAVAVLFAVLIYPSVMRGRPGGLLFFNLSLVLAIAYGLAAAVRGIEAQPAGARRTFSQRLLFAAASLAAGHCAALLAAIGPVMISGRRANILIVILVLALVSLLGALWAALALRVARRPTTLALLLLALGWVAVVAAWIAAELAGTTVAAATFRANLPFWSVLGRVFEGGSRATLPALEALYWQLVWPLLGLVALGGMLLSLRGPREPVP
jgi:hypothetical protein